MCLAVALWNGKDPILKERLFGLTNREGNHGEDVKELYYYLDAVPTYSYARMLYKYPQAEFPYAALVAENARRSKLEPEFEIIDTGIFDADRYFDVDIEYGKAGVEDILLRITVHNRGPEEAAIHILPQLWFRNTWSWFTDHPKPVLTRVGENILIDHPDLGVLMLDLDRPDEIQFCENETNAARLSGAERGTGVYKDGFHDYLVKGDKSAVNARGGTKAAGICRRAIPPGGSTTVRARLSRRPIQWLALRRFRSRFSRRANPRRTPFTPNCKTRCPTTICAGSSARPLPGCSGRSNISHYDVTEWLEGDPAQPKPPEARRKGRNSGWVHANMEDVISVPDKWEFPWFAAWDWAFQLTTLAYLDLQNAKDQLNLLCQPWYMHPNGQLPAYEWNFGDVNPPVHAWAALRLYEAEQRHEWRGRPEVSREASSPSCCSISPGG